MKWINASERLPEDAERIFIRNKDTQAGGMVHRDTLKELDGKHNIEWLDESESPSPTAVSETDNRVKYLRGQATTVFELTKGYTSEQRLSNKWGNNTFNTMEEMAGYVLELSQLLLSSQYKRSELSDKPVVGKSKWEIEYFRLRDCYNRYIHLLSGELSKFRKLAKDIHGWSSEVNLSKKVAALDRLEKEFYQLSIAPESTEIITEREQLADTLEAMQAYADQALPVKSDAVGYNDSEILSLITEVACKFYYMGRNKEYSDIPNDVAEMFSHNQFEFAKK